MSRWLVIFPGAVENDEVPKTIQPRQLNDDVDALEGWKIS
jgi:hypothetical protein